MTTAATMTRTYFGAPQAFLKGNATMNVSVVTVHRQLPARAVPLLFSSFWHRMLRGAIGQISRVGHRVNCSILTASLPTALTCQTLHLAINPTRADKGMRGIKVAQFRFETFSSVTCRATGWNFRFQLRRWLLPVRVQKRVVRLWKLSIDR